MKRKEKKNTEMLIGKMNIAQQDNVLLIINNADFRLVDFGHTETHAGNRINVSANNLADGVNLSQFLTYSSSM